MHFCCCSWMLQILFTYAFASGSEVRGFDPSRIDWFCQILKILSMTSFGREVKPWDPCRTFTARKWPQAEIRASEQNLSDFSRSMSQATLTTKDVKKCRKTQQQHIHIFGFLKDVTRIKTLKKCLPLSYVNPEAFDLFRRIKHGVRCTS